LIAADSTPSLLAEKKKSTNTKNPTAASQKKTSLAPTKKKQVTEGTPV